MTSSDKRQDAAVLDEDGNDTSFANVYALVIAMAIPAGMIIGLVALDNLVYGMVIGMALSPIIAMLVRHYKKLDLGD